jgi:hypothetical protein
MNLTQLVETLHFIRRNRGSTQTLQFHLKIEIIDIKQNLTKQIQLQFFK